MPAPLVAAGIAAGAQLLSSGINAASTASMNKKTRKWNEKMYGIQRADALADWDRENAYNSPQAQMARLKEAGLNPNLVYGNGADAQGGSVRSTDVKPWSPEAPRADLGATANAGLSAYYDTQIKQSQLDMQQKQMELADMEKNVKAAQIAEIGMRTNTGNYNLEFEQSLRDINYNARVAALNKTLADTKYTLDNNERAAISQDMSLKEAAERILNMRADRAKTADERQQIRSQIHNLKLDGELKQLDINLRKMGINPNDPMYMRMLGQILNGGGLNAPTFKNARPGVNEGIKGGLNSSPFTGWLFKD